MKNLPRPQRTFRYYYLRFIRLKGDPHSLALGLAVGVFIGITPTIPLHTIMALTVALVLRCSKIAALLATVLVSNPLTIVPQYYISWKIGGWLTRTDISWERVQGELDYLLSGPGFWESIRSLGDLGIDALFTLVLGGCILALPFTLVAYFLSRSFFATIRKKRQEKHLLT